MPRPTDAASGNCRYRKRLFLVGGVVNSTPPFFMIASLVKQQVPACTFFLLASTVSLNATPTGSVEGRLKIVSRQEVQLADRTPPAPTAENYSDYPLVVLSQDDKKEVARVTPDGNGNYRVVLPPGHYVLDIQDWRHKHIRAASQPFTVISNQTVRVDMDIDTGVR